MSILDDIQTARASSADLVRRAVVVAIARASASYQPSSYQDAVGVRNQVVALLDQEIETAGDAGEDASFNALRALRVAVITDLNARGVTLPQIQTFRFNANMPDLVLAYRLYGDVTRADGLVRQANPQHPSFMPRQFRALAS
jgi:prophage DNA circulation protein